MPRCTVDADFLKSVLEEAKAAERWAEATYQLFMKKGEITEYAMRRIQYTESILNIQTARKPARPSGRTGFFFFPQRISPAECPLKPDAHSLSLWAKRGQAL